jgi:hypothetical protein
LTQPYSRPMVSNGRTLSGVSSLQLVTGPALCRAFFYVGQ